jgi:hypothetical protein
LLMESVQPYTTLTTTLDGNTWYVGKTLEVLNNWARMTGTENSISRALQSLRDG